ncbi:DNA-formamidopyrimidine glycosylase [candidate division WWE3 bacterium RBG_19FT_COMBO_34_6]|uniref:DNA-formamidopyrimidine glycosylase n=1 Tax=candidate division WWE3 bacterium RBG_19FT_COMBO_34_6 TaxID=1802612 RepID=A0A1F4UKR3_UNCKA|nr:MAG: DNA-formamidopyrimidine glycosylase [candidate division WWE3 bacterium RBG_19FT_COMBO_34_6]
MPELPEIITIRNNLRDEVLGKRILDIISYRKYPLKPSRAYFDKHALNRAIDNVFNIGKMLVLELSSGYFIVIHLKMTGNLLLNKQDPYVRITLKLDKNTSLNFSTVRLFEYFALWDKQKIENYKKTIGKTPIESDLSFKQFRSIFEKTSTAIKTALLDQKRIAGLGNIYVNEALFLAKINPKRPSNSLSQQEFLLLFKKIESVLLMGIKNHGSSFNRYKDLYGRSGSQQKFFYVYGKKDKLCIHCGTSSIFYEKIHGRGTFYCPKCQI